MLRRYIQIKFRDHKLISLGRIVEKIHPKIKKIYKILHFIVLIMTSLKNKPKLFSWVKSTSSHLLFKFRMNFLR